MGMFDYVHCKAKLPGTPPVFVKDGHDFQTKDLDCCMDTYEITADGRLVQDDGETKIPLNGTVEFYTSNCSANYLGVMFTRDGSDYEFVEYRAVFKDGRLQGEIEETARERKKALPQAKLDELEKRPSPAEVGDWKARCEQNRLGTTMHLRYGGGGQGVDGVVVAESETELVFRLVDAGRERFVVEDRRGLDRVLFESAAAADRIGGERQAKRERDAAELQAMLGQ